MKRCAIHLFALMLCILIASYGNGQKFQRVDLPKIFDTSYEISGLAVKGAEFYLLSEKCKRIFVLNAVNYKLKNTIDLSSLIKEDVQLEGIVVSGDHIFLTDELKGRVFEYNTEIKSFNEVLVLGSDLANFIGEEGLEGIALDITGTYCYLLRERNKKESTSEILVFKITEYAGKFSMQLKAIFKVKHANAVYRYSDICYDAATRKLYILKSFFAVDLAKAEYYIDIIDTEKMASRIPIPLVDQSIKSMKITKEVVGDPRKYPNYSTNLEGIAVYNGRIYIVSDNREVSTAKDCKQKGEKTLFLVEKK